MTTTEKPEQKDFTLDDAFKIAETNPQAGSLAAGMLLLQSSHREVCRIDNIIMESQQEKIAELERELDYWVPLGRKWLAFKNLLADPIYAD